MAIRSSLENAEAGRLNAVERRNNGLPTGKPEKRRKHAPDPKRGTWERLVAEMQAAQRDDIRRVVCDYRWNCLSDAERADMTEVWT
ncbi:MAG: hypothetical protein Q7R45_07250 [Sulfuricaulis sp.]|nr:hypothetical protein [Sulfuricaulis sp.]